MAFNCILDSGYVLDCNSVGGVEKVWLGTWDGDTTYTFDADSGVAGATYA